MTPEPLLADLLESGMLLAFGLAWPVNIVKSLQSRTARGKSIFFLLIVILGYICGISAKLVTGALNYVLLFYFINMVMVGIDTALYFRNLRLDRVREGALYVAVSAKQKL